jgi:histidyl-tRNA synthetase
MIQSVRGTKDTLPDEIFKWQYLENIFKNVSDKYGYKELRTPIFEKTEVFSRSIGENTDIVNKEMYTFEDRGGDSITLRPEMTAALVRAVIQHSITRMNSVNRLWYFGPFFRYERPQKGRLRQFHQFGAELISSPYPEADAEIIQLSNHLIKSLNIEDYKLLINSLGNEKSRADYKEKLVDYLKQNQNNLSYDSKNRLETNPLRVLDSKDPQDKDVIINAPQIINSLDKESKLHFDNVINYLEKSNIKYEIDSNLVRGLDYYSHTVFEFQSTALGAQDSFGGGGRYDGLFEQLGGKPVPAVGFAMGVERLLIILEDLKKLPTEDNNIDIFVVISDNQYYDKGNIIAEELRSKGYNVMIELQRRSMKAQFKEANKINAKYNLIIAENELNNNAVNIKNMKTGEQTEIPIPEINNFNFEI